MDTSTMKPDFFSKIGPLPAWAWGAMVVGAFLLYRRFSGARPPAAIDPGNLVVGPEVQDGEDWNSAGSMGGVGPASSGYNYGDVLSGSYTGTTGGTVFTTNQMWGVYAINNLPKLGYSAGETVSAITFYLAGMPLTAAQSQIIQAAILNFGSPPLPMPVTSSADIATPAVVGSSPAPVVSSPVSPVVSAPMPVSPTPVGDAYSHLVGGVQSVGKIAQDPNDPATWALGAYNPPNMVQGYQPDGTYWQPYDMGGTYAAWRREMNGGIDPDPAKLYDHLPAGAASV
jgi:hypothetical protein